MHAAEGMDLDHHHDGNVLRKHVAFFDQNNDGIIYPWETFRGIFKYRIAGKPNKYYFSRLYSDLYHRFGSANHCYILFYICFTDFLVCVTLTTTVS